MNWLPLWWSMLHVLQFFFSPLLRLKHSIKVILGRLFLVAPGGHFDDEAGGSQFQSRCKQNLTMLISSLATVKVPLSKALTSLHGWSGAALLWASLAPWCLSLHVCLWCDLVLFVIYIPPSILCTASHLGHRCGGVYPIWLWARQSIPWTGVQQITVSVWYATQNTLQCEFYFPFGTSFVWALILHTHEMGTSQSKLTDNFRSSCFIWNYFLNPPWGHHTMYFLWTNYFTP